TRSGSRGPGSEGSTTSWSWRDGRVVMQRPAKPCTPVRFRVAPPLNKSRKPALCGLFLVRPACAHSSGCKSRRKLITANEAKRNCARVTERGEEAWSVSCEPMNKNRIEGAAEQGERARNREALVIKAKWRRSGGCAAKECVLTWGDLAL